MNKKIIFLIGVLIILILILIINLDSSRKIARKYLPSKTKNTIKEIVLGKDTINKLNELQNLKTKNHLKKHYNENELPNTQFLKLNYKEIELKKLSLNKQVLENYDRSIHSKSSFFLEQFNDNLIIVSETGEVFFIKKAVINENENFDLLKIHSNINQIKIQILDALVINDDLFISHSKYKSEKCNSLNISKAKINQKKLIFESFFETKDCQPKFFAGRMYEFKHNEKDGLLLTSDIWGVTLINENERKEKTLLAQEDNSSFGKILFIDMESNSKIFSKGHRAPQGLLVVDNKFIISTEHGPRGGDEINLIKFGNNYGWPISSYGDLYPYQKKTDKKFEYLKNHELNGFVEPIYSFVPSIGISQIIEVPDDFSEFWKNNFLLSSLNGSSLHRLQFDKNFTKLLFNEKIFIGKRIRDIIYVKEFKTFILSMDAEEGYLGFLNSKLN